MLKRYAAACSSLLLNSRSASSDSAMLKPNLVSFSILGFLWGWDAWTIGLGKGGWITISG